MQVYWNALILGLVAGLAALAPVAVLCWVGRVVFVLGRWKGRLATKEELQAAHEATMRAVEAARR